MAKLTDKEKKKIVADYVECGVYSQVARKHNVSATTVRKIVNAEEESFEKFQHKKEENTVDILQHMESKKELVCELIDLYLLFLADPEKIQNATLPQISTALGTVIDKFTKHGTVDSQSAEEAHNDLISAIKRVVNED